MLVSLACSIGLLGDIRKFSLGFSQDQSSITEYFVSLLENNMNESQTSFLPSYQPGIVCIELPNGT